MCACTCVSVLRHLAPVSTPVRLLLSTEHVVVLPRPSEDAARSRRGAPSALSFSFPPVPPAPTPTPCRWRRKDSLSLTEREGRTLGAHKEAQCGVLV